MATPTGFAADRVERQPYYPGWKPPLVSQCALTSMAVAFSTILPRQLSNEMTLYALAAL